MSDQGRAYVWKHSPYKGALFTIHVALGDVANDLHDNRLWMKAGVLASKARTTRQTVVEALSRMSEDGFLERLSPETRQHRPVEYRFLMPEVPVVFAGDVSAEPTPEVSSTVTPVSALTTPGVGSDDTEPKKNQSPTKGKTSSPSARKPRPRDELFDAITEAWMGARGRLKPVPARAAGRIVEAKKQLADIGVTPDEVLDFARLWRRAHPGAECTPQAVTANWPTYASGELAGIAAGAGRPRNETTLDRHARRLVEEVTDGDLARGRRPGDAAPRELPRVAG